MPETDKQILIPLNNLLAANDRLAAAIQDTRDMWPYVSQCWIDDMSEPTKDLAQYRIKPTS